VSWAKIYFRTKWCLHPSSRLANRHGPKIRSGWGCFFLEVAGSPSNTKSPRSRPTSIPGGILVHPAVWPQRTLAENWGLCPFSGVGTGSPTNTVSPRLPTSVPSGILIHTAVWPQRTLAENWGLCPFRGGGAGFHLTQCRVGRGIPPYQVAF